MRYLGCLVLVLLVGCMTVEERRTLMLENADKNCTAMGFTKGTPEHSNCQLDLVKAAVGGRTVVMPAAQQAPTTPRRCVPVGSGVNCY